MTSSKNAYRTLLRVFPPPEFVRMAAVGIDINRFSLKYLKLKESKGGLSVERYGIEDIPDGAIEQGIVKDPKVVVDVLRKVQLSTGATFVHMSLPEDQAYLFITEIPNDASYEDARSLIELRLKENVPLSPTETVFDYTPMCEPAPSANTTAVAVSVYPAEAVAQYASVVEEAGMMPLSFEIESGASARSTIPETSGDTMMVIDLGRAGAGVSIVNACALAFTSTLEINGDDLTKAIARTLDLSYAEAEKLKREHGFIKRPESEAVFNAMLGTVSALRDEILKHFAYWQVHNAKEYSFASPIKKVLLVGGNANLKGLREYLKASIDVPVEKGNVWVNVAPFEKYIPPIERMESYRYATAAGLALRGVMRE